MAAATSSRKKRQTTAKKRKVSARAGAESKAYLNGNHYSKLSGMYLTSLDYTKAVSEWNAIPYLQTMYGAKLCGYSMDPGDAPGNSTFVSKDSALTSGGGVYFQHPNRLKYKTMQLFTTRDIELSSDIDDIHHNTYYQYLYGCWTSTTTLHNGIILERLPLCLKGPSSFS